MPSPEQQDELTRWRRDLHAHPELGFEEERTADFVARKLEEFGVDVTRGVGGTGVVGVLRVGNETAFDWPAGRHGRVADHRRRTRLRTAPGTTATCMPAATTGTPRCC